MLSSDFSTPDAMIPTATRVLRATMERGSSRSAVGTFLLKILATGLAFATGVLLARTLGTEGYGEYAFVQALLHIASIAALVGINELTVREMTAARATERWSDVWSLARTSLWLPLATSTLIAMSLAIVVGNSSTPPVVVTIAVGMAFLPPVVLTASLQSILRSFGRVLESQLPGLAIRPALTLALTLTAVISLGSSFDAAVAVIAAGLGSFGALLFASWRSTRQLRGMPRTDEGARPSFQWVRASMPFLLIGGLYVINARTDIVMLGSLAGTAEAGIYTVANRGAELVSFVLYAVNVVVAPRFASLYASSDRLGLERLFRQSLRATLGGAILIVVPLILLGPWFLLLFGSEFQRGYPVLLVLCIGQLVNALAGPVGQLLNMVRLERITSRGVGLSALVNIALNALLIPEFGALGASIATAVSTVLWNVLLAVFVFRRLGYYPLLGLFDLRR